SVRMCGDVPGQAGSSPLSASLALVTRRKSLHLADSEDSRTEVRRDRVGAAQLVDREVVGFGGIAGASVGVTRALLRESPGLEIDFQQVFRNRLPEFAEMCIPGIGIGLVAIFEGILDQMSLTGVDRPAEHQFRQGESGLWVFFDTADRADAHRR